MRENNPRLLLARVRKADFAHPGDFEAIDILMKHLETHQPSSPLKILDAGCGRGGTADYIKKTTPNILSFTGVDMDKKAIAHAQSTCVNINFKIVNIAEIDQKLTEKFNLIYMMSVYYALPDDLKKDSLVKIANLAENDAVLAVSDYVSLREDTEPLIDFSETPMLPVEINQFKNSFKETGWELVTEIDISDKYDEWYSEFLAKMLEKKSELLLDFTEEAFNQVTDTFTTILNKIKTKHGVAKFSMLN